MKIYTKVVYQITDTGFEKLDEESFDYEGPIASADPTTAIIGGSIVSGLIGADAAGDAAAATAGASAAQIAEARRQFDLVRGDTGPYRDVGQSALYQLAGLSGLPGFDGGRPPANQASTPAPVTPEIVQLQQRRAQLAQRLGPLPAGFEDDAASIYAQAEAGREMQQIQARIAQLQAQSNEIDVPRFAPPDTNVGQTRGAISRVLTAVSPQRDNAALSVPGSVPGSVGRTPTEILESTPGYKFRLSESEKALERMQAARGYSMAPRAAKEVGRYVSDYASGEYGNYLEQLFRLSGLGGNAVNTSANAGANAASQIGSAAQFGGAGAANAAMVGGQSINNAIQGGLSNYTTLQMYNNMMNQLRYDPSNFQHAGY